MFEITSSRTDNEAGLRFVTIDDKYDFVIAHHPGRQAINAARLVRKLMLPQVAEGMKSRNETLKRMSKADRERVSELQDFYLALPDKKSDDALKLENEINAIISQYADRDVEMINAVQAMAASLDIEQEAMLDSILFAYTKGCGKSLANDDVFNELFRGPKSAMIELLRNEIIEHNGFLDQITG